MDKLKKINWKQVGTITLIVGLFVAGVGTTLAYQKSIDNIKASGVAEYKALHCERYADKDNKVQWLECEVN